MVVKINLRKRANTRRTSRAPPRQAARASPSTEPTALGKALRVLGAAGGTALGGYFGNPAIGSAAGNSLGAAVSKWLGAGDYEVAANSIVRQTLKSSDAIPTMHREGQSVVVRHKEYLGEVTANQTFTINNAYALNPGLASTFPWLCGVADRFQEYRFKGIVFHYVPSSGSLSSGTSNALGTVMMQTSYRSNDSPPASKVEMLNEYWSSESVPSEPFCHPIECDPKENPFNVQYVRTGNVPAGDNQLIYDLGVTHVATSGQQVNGVVLGDLWITYEVELKKPIVASNATTAIKYLEQAFSAPTGADWFSTPSSNLGNLSATFATRTISFPKASQGTWLITIKFVASTTFSAFNTAGAITLTNCVGYPVDPTTSGTSSGQALGGGTPTLSEGYLLQAITIDNPQLVATVAFPSITVTGTASRLVATITRIF